MPPWIVFANAILPTEPGFVGAWVGAAIVVMGGLSTLTGLVAIFATRREVEALNERLKTLEKAVGDQSRVTDQRLDALGSEFGEATRAIHHDIGEMKQNLPMQIVALLRNTGAIKP